MWRRIALVILLLTALLPTYAEPLARTYNTPLDVDNLRNATAYNLFSGMTSRITSRVNTSRNHTTALSRHKTIDDTRPGDKIFSAHKSRLIFRRLSAHAGEPRPHIKALSEHSNHKGPQGHSSSEGNRKQASPKQQPDSDAISKLPKVGMFYHIPKVYKLFHQFLYLFNVQFFESKKHNCDLILIMSHPSTNFFPFAVLCLVRRVVPRFVKL